MDSQGTDESAKTSKNEVKRKKKQNIPVSQLTREELEARFSQLEAHNKQLLNLLAKSQGSTNDVQSSKKSRKQRPFDFSKHSKRHVVLKFAYLGWDYSGFAVQEDTQQTIEAQLFSALLKTRLIESRETSNYHRCGRTDKGVSAFDQVISITLRSRLKAGIGIIHNEKSEPLMSEEDDTKEINYVSLLNKVLSPEIRMLAWCPVAEGYSARFDCSHRTYKYFFPRGNLDIKVMNEAAQYLIGYHDYRNFCKMDVGNGIVNFWRRILAIKVCEVSCDLKKKTLKSTEMETDIEKCLVESEHSFTESKNVNHKNSSNGRTTSSCIPSLVSSETSDGCETDQSLDGYDMCVATIEGQAFLWHQVRAIMAVLFFIGEGKEKPSIIQELLNVEKHPRKPQYCLASDVPLNLYETTFDGVDWRWENDVLQSVISQLQALWTQHSVRATMIRRMLWDLETRYQYLQGNDVSIEKKVKTTTNESSSSENDYLASMKLSTRLAPQDQSETLLPGAKHKVYRPLLSRPTCESLETRVEHYVKRRRLDPDILEKMASAGVVTASSSSQSD